MAKTKKEKVVDLKPKAEKVTEEQLKKIKMYYLGKISTKTWQYLLNIIQSIKMCPCPICVVVAALAAIGFKKVKK